MWTTAELRRASDAYKVGGPQEAARVTGRTVNACRLAAKAHGFNRLGFVHGSLSGVALKMMRDGPVTAFDLMCETGCSRQVAGVTMQRLVERGMAHKTGNRERIYSRVNTLED